jgi:hypothetical protein
MIGQMFVQIHPHSACSKMHSHFAETYRLANAETPISQQMLPVEIPAPPRRGPMPERRRTMVAVAVA